MNIAIVGSREYKHTLAIRSYMELLPKDTVIISGGARGVDQIAAYEAGRLGLGLSVYEADWDKHGKKAGFLRNRQIVEAADEVVAFWDGLSKGTQHTINLTKIAKKPLTIVRDEANAIPCQSK